jgi:hypothetical protein
VNDAEADRLAARIINTWHGGPSKLEWVDTLRPLDAGTAGTAFVRLQRRLEHAPTIAGYLREYNGLHTKPPAELPQSCPLERCPGDGWVTVHYESGGRPYRGVVPCTCAAGRANESTYASARNGATR